MRRNMPQAAEQGRTGAALNRFGYDPTTVETAVVEDCLRCDAGGVPASAVACRQISLLGPGSMSL